jgi:hypothetical protein
MKIDEIKSDLDFCEHICCECLIHDMCTELLLEFLNLHEKWKEIVEDVDK